MLSNSTYTKSPLTSSLPCTRTTPIGCGKFRIQVAQDSSSRISIAVGQIESNTSLGGESHHSVKDLPRRIKMASRWLPPHGTAIVVASTASTLPVAYMASSSSYNIRSNTTSSTGLCRTKAPRNKTGKTTDLTPLTPMSLPGGNRIWVRDS